MSKPFRSDKRRKELLRLKKQEEKRLRRFGKKENADESPVDEGTQAPDLDASESAPEAEKPEA
ncbi:MAG TPA: hypothetical protein VMT62_02330 [Syntrophorhabdaceae bacterium]|nr:hypothetical protein [Syntrophorhabdaceae bacterium]